MKIQAAQERHLHSILDLQRKNLPDNLSAETMRDEGFVTVVHDFPILKAMNDIHPHAIALDGDHVVGYALAMDRSFAKEIPFLVSLFERIDAHLLKSNPNASMNYIVMGQICINKNYRSQGIFPKMYKNLKVRLSDNYTSIFTDIACKNTRSIRAHQKVGFQSVEVFTVNEERWDIVEWQWNEP